MKRYHPLLLCILLMAGCGNPSAQPTSTSIPVLHGPKGEVVLPVTLVFSNLMSEPVYWQLVTNGAVVNAPNGSAHGPFFFHFDAVDNDDRRNAVNAALLNGAYVVGGDR